MLISDEQVAAIPNFMNMDMSNVLNIGGLAIVARSTDGREKKTDSHFSTQKKKRSLRSP